MASQRGQWGSRLGFILAAAGSAVGLGNIWKFPYVTGMNGGGWFVLIYLICIAVIGLPIMIAEIMIGRTAQRSPAGAFKELAGKKSPWVFFGISNVVVATILLSYYSVVAGWALHYVSLSVQGTFTGQPADQIAALFGGVTGSWGASLFWHLVFMVFCISIVLGGVRSGLERWSRILMPALVAMMLVLLVRAMVSDGFVEGLRFVFWPDASKLTQAGVLEAMGHAFFTLSVGMGALLTFGSYLGRGEDVVGSSAVISVFDTLIALLAAMVLFPIIFGYGMEPSAGPGLVFKSLPIAFGQMPGGAIFASVFFVLLTFAALTSAISLLEVASAYFIDERGWSRQRATLATGLFIAALGVPSALSNSTDLFGADFAALTARFGLNDGKGLNWFGTFDYLVSNWCLPLGGLLIALFVGWRLDPKLRAQSFAEGSRWASFYPLWLQVLRIVVPASVVAVLLHGVGVL